ncbi:phage fiber-tail adaptor protein [Glacieibacterium frigidum]|uniref:Uncharacterized protein n=1 Tax=Glacieibacterium frigidum TaxID=2593303 RepID=A0A552U817_9SPHN|nr:hypothetical protein [Glacieibacterium frigidum]TRW14366.1 hypothetical protein FMM06_11685 [Glacieibacterium frigidum]
MTIFLKDPQAGIDYAVDWGAAYLQGQTITGSVWAVTPDEAEGVRVTGELGSATRTAATLAGGEPGKLYRVANRVTLSDGRTDERSVTLRIEQR